MASLNFTLYSNPSFPRNLWKDDIRSLSNLCRQFGGGDYSIEIVHLAGEPQRAFRDGVHTTPTVLLETESGRKQSLGNLLETEVYLKSRSEARRLDR